MKTSDKLDQAAPAISRMQGQLVCAKKSSKNPFYNSKYADLQEVWAVSQAPLSENGLSLIQAIHTDSHNRFSASVPIKNKVGDIVGVREAIMIWMTLTTRLQHISEQFFEDEITFPIEADPQTLGKVTTYIRRYAMMSMLGIAPEDDDGESAAGRQHVAQAPPTKTYTKQTSGVSKISFSQAKRFGAIALDRGWKDDEAKKMLLAHGVSESPKIWDMILSIPVAKYEAMVSILESGWNPPAPKEAT
ncbi:MAG: ERF family protein [Parcubacteria group bacterium]